MTADTTVRHWARMAAAGTLLASSVTTQAATVSASAAFDWSQISATFIGGELAFDSSNESSRAFASVADAPADASDANDWGIPLYANSVSPLGSAHATNAVPVIQSTAAWTAVPGTLGSSFAMARRSADLTVIGSGSGLLVISIPVSLSISLTGLAPGDYATLVSATTFLRLSKPLEPGESVSSSSRSLSGGDAETEQGIDDLLGVVISIHPGDVVHFELEASVNAQGGAAPVPLPAGIWLLAPGLVGLGAARRRAT